MPCPNPECRAPDEKQGKRLQVKHCTRCTWTNCLVCHQNYNTPREEPK